MKIFNNIYDGESIIDISQDVSEAFDNDFNQLAAAIPSDEHGLHKGTFTVPLE